MARSSWAICSASDVAPACRSPAPGRAGLAGAAGTAPGTGTPGRGLATGLEASTRGRGVGPATKDERPVSAVSDRCAATGGEREEGVIARGAALVGPVLRMFRSLLRGRLGRTRRGVARPPG